MHYLSTIHHRFERRAIQLDGQFYSIVAGLPNRSQFENWFLLEGLTSHCWQFWCQFCRQLLVAVGVGCTNRQGVILNACSIPPTWQRVSYFAMVVAQGSPPKPAKTNSSLRKEPTWGDISKVMDIIQALNPANKAQLVAAFGGIARGPRHLQIVRNAAAHMNGETYQEVRALRPYYDVKPWRHPSEVTLWVDPTSKNYAFSTWIADMRTAADAATA